MTPLTVQPLAQSWKHHKTPRIWVCLGYSLVSQVVAGPCLFTSSLVTCGQLQRQACYQQLHLCVRSLAYLLVNLSNCPAPQDLQSMSQRVEVIKLQAVRTEKFLTHIKMQLFHLFNSGLTCALDMGAYTCAVVPYSLSLTWVTLLHVPPGSAGVSLYPLWLLHSTSLWMDGGGGAFQRPAEYQLLSSTRNQDSKSSQVSVH